MLNRLIRGEYWLIFIFILKRLLKFVLLIIVIVLYKFAFLGLIYQDFIVLFRIFLRLKYSIFRPILIVLVKGILNIEFIGNLIDLLLMFEDLFEWFLLGLLWLLGSLWQKLELRLHVIKCLGFFRLGVGLFEGYFNLYSLGVGFYDLWVNYFLFGFLFGSLGGFDRWNICRRRVGRYLLYLKRLFRILCVLLFLLQGKWILFLVLAIMKNIFREYLIFGFFTSKFSFIWKLVCWGMKYWGS